MGVELNSEAAHVARYLLGERAVVEIGDFVDVSARRSAHYDLVVFDPPFGIWLDASHPLSLPPGEGRLDMSQAMLIWGAGQLTSSGSVLALMPGMFGWSPNSARVQAHLNEGGFRIRALIHLPPGTLRARRLEAYLVVLDRERQADVFVAQYRPDDVHQKQLIENMRRSRPGPTPGLGRLLPLGDFRGFGVLESRERLSRLARASAWQARASGDLFREHEVTQAGRFKLEHGPHSIYLRLDGEHPVRQDVPAPSRRRGVGAPRVLHIVLDPAHVNARYYVRWLNDSEIGQTTLSASRLGTVVGRVDPGLFLTTPQYLPDIESQGRILATLDRLDALRSSALEIETTLLSGPSDLDAAVERVEHLNRENSLRIWLDALPFPLASILWRHHTEHDQPHASFTTLLHFFEATASFLATIHLSAFMSSEELWADHGQRLSAKLQAQGLSLERATFGAWRLIFDYLSAASARLYGDQEQAGVWAEVYGSSSTRLPKLLCAPVLRDVLQRANKLRNDHLGHTGAIGRAQAEELSSEALSVLHHLRGAWGLGWSQYPLVRAGQGTYKRGMHEYHAERLVGMQGSPFEKLQISSKIPLEDQQLYLFDPDSQSGLRLLPFVRVMPSPHHQANACFMFSRSAGKEARFVSYHFEQESDIQVAFPELDTILGRMGVRGVH